MGSWSRLSTGQTTWTVTHMKHYGVILGILLPIFSSGWPADATAETPVPLTRAHAHNDYAHARPLFDALEHGFGSVEADIYLVEGQLLVAHDRDKVDPRRTLQSLYLEPLRQRVRSNGGRVYRHGPPCWLLIDVKTEAESTYAVLHKVLEGYADILTEFRAGQVKTNALTVVISGNRSRTALGAQAVRYATYDGRLADLGSTEPGSFMPWISDNWALHFKWRGQGPLPASDQAKLNDILAQAHRHGRLVRFWGAPDRPAVWEVFYAAGVDLLNTDDLAGMQKFLLEKGR